MLDTDACSYLMRGASSVLDERVAGVPVDDVCMSVITLAELRYGVAVSPRPDQDGRALEALLRYVQVFDLPEAAAQHYAAIRADLRRRGAMIGANDLFIAAHARSLDLVLVTNNVSEFGRVPGLEVENWSVREPFRG
jgi:tRNA(fMet)-specific endonuclease VapC